MDCPSPKQLMFRFTQLETRGEHSKAAPKALMGKKDFACTVAMVTSSSHLAQQWGQKAVAELASVSWKSWMCCCSVSNRLKASEGNHNILFFPMLTADQLLTWMKRETMKVDFPLCSWQIIWRIPLVYSELLMMRQKLPRRL